MCTMTDAGSVRRVHWRIVLVESLVVYVHRRARVAAGVEHWRAEHAAHSDRTDNDIATVAPVHPLSVSLSRSMRTKLLDCSRYTSPPLTTTWSQAALLTLQVGGGGI